MKIFLFLSVLVVCVSHVTATKGGGGGGGADTTVCDVEHPMDVEEIRSVLKEFKRSLDEDDDDDHHDDEDDHHRLVPSAKKRAYHRDASSQIKDWHTCTIVQQCRDPHFMLSLGLMSSKSRGLAYKALSKVMSQEAYNMLQLQQLSNMLLGEIQDWATTCDGKCYELKDEDGELGELGEERGRYPSKLLRNLDIDECADLRENEQRHTLWRCNDGPSMVVQGDLNTQTGRYKLDNAFAKPHTHGRNSQYDYFSVYGDLSKKTRGAFGLRFSGHHIDLNYMWDEDGNMITDLPVFLGHNPMFVPLETPPLTRGPDEVANVDEQGDHYLMWHNMAGVPQFAESIALVLDCAHQLQKAKSSYIPLRKWKGTGYFGGLSLMDEDETIDDYDPMYLSKIDDDEFDKMWGLIQYTLKFSRGKRSTNIERDLFRKEGKAVWTTSSPPKDGLPLSEEDMLYKLKFFYVQVETKDWIFYCMVNQMWSFVSESEGTNHLHSIVIKKDYLNCDNACCPGSDCPP